MMQSNVFQGKAVPKKLRSELQESFVPLLVFDATTRLFAAHKPTFQSAEQLKIYLGALESVFKHRQTGFLR